MNYLPIALLTISYLLFLCSGAAIEEPEKFSVGWGSPGGWGSAIPSNGTTVSAGQTIVGEHVASNVTYTDNVNVTAYSSDGAILTSNHTSNLTGFQDFYTDYMVGNPSNDTYIYNNGDDVYQDAAVLHQTVAGADNIASVNFTQNPTSVIAFSADTLGVSAWITGSEGTNVSPGTGSGGWNSGSGWKEGQ
ncbi:unnamed protein product [Orchesella dallaii]|uniref:Uncharacterized protein n=1 Tax=Orchesella dallaii TaxID=48710 RepID=A0ABP1S0M6_9HEXA